MCCVKMKRIFLQLYFFISDKKILNDKISQRLSKLNISMIQTTYKIDKNFILNQSIDWIHEKNNY